VEFGQAMQRAELAWVGQLMDDIRSGALPWTTEIEEPRS